MNEGVPSRRQVLRATVALGGAAAAIPALGGTALGGTALAGTARAAAGRAAANGSAGTGSAGTVRGGGRVPLDAVAEHIAAGLRRPRIPRRRFSIADFGATADSVTAN